MPLTHAEEVPLSALLLQKDIATHGGYRATKFEFHWFGLQPFLSEFCKGLHGGTCHVAPITPKLAPLSVCHSDASNSSSPIPMGPVIQAPEAKRLDTQTHRQTLTKLLFSVTLQRKSLSIKPSVLKQ